MDLIARCRDKGRRWIDVSMVEAMARDASQVRFVMCPKCSRLLKELVHVPVFSCGVCGTVLQAKARQSNEGNGTSQVPGNLPENRSDASDDVPTWNEQTDPSSTDANSREMRHGGDHRAVLCEEPPRSISENDSHQEECNCSEGEGSTPDFPNSAGEAAPTGEEITISVASAQLGRELQAGADSCSNGVDRRDSDNSSSSCKMGESAESGVSEEETVNGYPGNGLHGNLGTPTTRNAHASDDSISSCDEISCKRETYGLLSPRTFRNRRVSLESNGARERDTGKEEERLVGSEVTALPDEAGSKQRSSSRYDAETSDQDASQDSENLCSVQNGLESSPPSRSLSTDPTFLRIPTDDRMELLAKVESLRRHLSRPYAGGRAGDRRFPVRGGARHEGRRPLFPDHESEHVFPPYCDANVSPWRPRAYGQTQVAQHRPNSSGMPFSARSSSSCSCSHHHREGYNVPVQLPSTICCMACSSDTCYRSPSSARSGCGSGGNASGHDLVKPPRRERRQQQHLKRHYRPVSGGAPFVVCHRCLGVLQLPVDFLVSGGRHHRLRCGACSQVLTFLHRSGHIVPCSGAQFDAPHDTMDHASKHEHSFEYVNHSRTRYPSRGSSFLL